MSQPSAKPIPKSDPLHGVTLEAILTELVAHYGWAQLAEQIAINCFKADPSIKSSLKFLRKTPWARQQVETLYLSMKGASARKRATKTPRALEAEKVRATLSLPKTKPDGRRSDQQTHAQGKPNNRSQRNGTVSKGQSKPAVNPWLKAKTKTDEA